MSRITLALFLAFTLSIAQATSVWSEPAKPSVSTSDFVIPIYFISDRRPAAVNLGDGAPDQIVCAQQISWGKIMVPVHGQSEPDRDLLTTLNWTTPQPMAEACPSIDEQWRKQPCAVMNIGASNGQQTPFNQPGMTEFLAEFSRMVLRSPQQRFILYAHGCCTSQKASFHEAADLAAATHLPVLIFDWATPGPLAAIPLPELNSYRRSERVLEISQINFGELLTTLSTALPAANCIFVGYSMGNRLILEDLLRRNSEKEFVIEQVHLVRPDVSLSAFLQQQHRYARFTKRLYIYSSDSDQMLKTSQNLSGGVARLGRLENFLNTAVRNGMLMDTPANRFFLNITNLTPVFSVGHDMPDQLISQVIQLGTDNPPGSAFKLEAQADTEGHLIQVTRIQTKTSADQASR